MVRLSTPPSPLHFNSKRNIPVWSARFSPLHQLIPHSIYSRFLLHTPPSITLYYKLNHPSLPHSAHGSGELCPRPHVICARRPRPSSAPRAFAPATSSARAAAALRAGRAPVPSATRPRSGRRRRPCPSRRRRAPGPRRRPSPLRRRRAPGRPRAPPLCAAASLGTAAPPLRSVSLPCSGPASADHRPGSPRHPPPGPLLFPLERRRMRPLWGPQRHSGWGGRRTCAADGGVGHFPNQWRERRVVGCIDINSK